MPLARITSYPPVLLLDHSRRNRVRPGGATRMGQAAFGGMVEHPPRRTHGNAMCRALRRLIMCSQSRLMVRLARRVAHALSNPRNYRARHFG